MHSHARSHAKSKARHLRVRGRGRHGRPRWWKIAVASPIHGSRESLVRQNQVAVGQDFLERIENDEQLSALTDNASLVPLPDTRKVTIESVLPENRRFCRPWTKSFVESFAEAHWLAFHKPIQVNSAVRTVEVQQSLRRWNGNAAGLEGDTASPHLTGATVDISKRTMTRAEQAWARQYLFGLQKLGKLDAEEEFRQPVFHITVYKAFAPETAEEAAEASVARYGAATARVQPFQF